MDEQEKFKKLVIFLASNYEKGDLEFDEEVVKFEDAIEKNGYGMAYFGTAKSNWDEIEVITPEHFPYKYKNEGVTYYAEYYDGMQAPFLVCKWNHTFYELEKLLKDTSAMLYQKYKIFNTEE